MYFVTKNYMVGLVENREDLIEAQNLRYRAFYKDRGLKAPDYKKELERDFDWFDPYSDHLVVIYHGDGGRKIVGNYRLLTDENSDKCGFNSEREFYLDPLGLFPGKIVELGRACVSPEHRSSGVIQLLWKGLMEYITQNKYDMMFGLASIPGTNLEENGPLLRYLHRKYMSKKDWAPISRTPDLFYPELQSSKQAEKQQAKFNLPPLLKAYLRVGGKIGNGAYIDAELDTIDVLMMVETKKICKKYQKKFKKKNLPQEEVTPEKLANLV